MPRSRLFIPDKLEANGAITLDRQRSHYLGTVLRMRTGQALRVFNGEQGEFEATIAAIDKTGARLLIGEALQHAVESPLRVHLVQAVSRGERMDWVVQKATELGCKRISPVLTSRCTVRLDGERADKRRDHWQKIADSACEQSGRVRPPMIDLPATLKSWLDVRSTRADVDVVLHPGASCPLVTIRRPETKLCVLVGPEGGLSANEVEVVSRAGFLPVSLGPRTLRTETAAVAAIAIVQSIWGDLGAD